MGDGKRRAGAAVASAGASTRRYSVCDRSDKLTRNPMTNIEGVSFGINSLFEAQPLNIKK